MQFVIKKTTTKNAFAFGLWCYYAFTVTVSYVITRDWWFRVYFIPSENFSLSIKSNFMHIAPRSEDDSRQLSKCHQSFLFLKETKWVSNKTTTTNLGRNHMAYPTLFHAVGTQCLVAVFLPLMLPPGLLPRGQSILWGGHSSLNRTMLKCPAAFLFE